MVLWAMGGITFEIPAAILVSFTAFIALFGGQGFNPNFLLAHLAGGGVIMAAFFMATDYVTTPIMTKGKWIFGIGCGILTFVIREFASMPEGCSFSILLMNLLTPYIDKFTMTKPLGAKPIKKKEEA